jgi:hypothetical protein
MDNERNDLETSLNIETTRRRLLSAATGGFALAASGLFLPNGLQVADARDGAAGGRLGGRHRKDHRGRGSRTHGAKKDKGKNHQPPGAGAPGGSLLRYVAIRAESPHYMPGMAVDFNFRVKGGLDEYGPLVFATTFENLSGTHTDYAPNRYAIAAYFRGVPLPAPVFVEFNNPFIGDPKMKLFTGGTIDGNGNLVGGTLLDSQALNFSPGTRRFQYDLGTNIFHNPIQLKLRRLPNSDTHQWFEVMIKWAD